jgi:IS30 family transposase
MGRRVHTGAIANRRFIDDRPLAANERSEMGHWETDSLLFSHEEALNVLVERLSRFIVLTQLAGKSARDTGQVLVERLRPLPCRSVTADNGSENADHAIVSQQLAIPFFFCHPYHSWEKGTVENTNGLIRRYLPRQTDLSRVSHTVPVSCREEDLDAIAAELNQRPRKCLGFRMPAEVLFGQAVALSH